MYPSLESLLTDDSIFFAVKSILSVLIHSLLLRTMSTFSTAKIMPPAQLKLRGKGGGDIRELFLGRTRKRD